MIIELTDEQRQALRAEQGKPIDVLDPATSQRYVLLAQEQYERMRSLLEQGTGHEQQEMPTGIAPGILRSQQAFWRDLPQLLSQKKLRGKWVCYHGDERIGIGTYEELIRECLRRGIPNDSYNLDVIEPHAIPPWQHEEVESGGNEVAYEEVDEQPDRTGEPA